MHEIEETSLERFPDTSPEWNKQALDDGSRHWEEEEALWTLELAQDSVNGHQPSLSAGLHFSFFKIKNTEISPAHAGPVLVPPNLNQVDTSAF
jgi:hypothetical protein